MANAINFGEIIKNRRSELGISQEMLCENTCCDVKSLYRIESGQSLPSKKIWDSLVQKLDLTDEKYYMVVDRGNFEILQLQNEITSLNSQRNFEKALERIEELENMCPKKDKLLAQFILRSKLLAGKMEKGFVQPYDNETCLEILFQAIRMTVKRFDIDAIANSLLSFEEVKIINQIAITYVALGNRRRAISIYNQLLSYTERRYSPCEEMAPIVILVAYNYSSQLGLTDRHDEALEIAKKGYNCCLKFGKARLLGHLLYNLAQSFYYLGRLQESKGKCYESFYVLRAMKEYDDLELVKVFAEDKFGIQFD